MEEFNHFSEFSEQLMEALGQVVRKAAFDVQAQAQANAPVDTGNLRNSIYTKTSEGNTYPGTASTDLIADQAGEADKMTAWVGVAANYGIYQELGSTRTPAQPYLGPAVDSVQGSFESALAAIESQINV